MEIHGYPNLSHECPMENMKIPLYWDRFKNSQIESIELSINTSYATQYYLTNWILKTYRFIKWFQNENMVWRISWATSNIVGNKHGDRAEPFFKESLVNAQDFKKAKNS